MVIRPKLGICRILINVNPSPSPKMGPHGRPPSRVEARLMPQTKWRVHQRHHWKSATRLSSGNFQPVSEKELETMEKPGKMWICQCVTTEVMVMSIPKMMRNWETIGIGQVPHVQTKPCGVCPPGTSPHPDQHRLSKPTKKSMSAREYWEMYPLVI